VFLKQSFEDILAGRCVHMNRVYIQVRKRFIAILNQRIWKLRIRISKTVKSANKM